MQNAPLSEELDLTVKEQLTKQFAATTNVDGEPFASREVDIENFSKRHGLNIDAPLRQEMSQDLESSSQLKNSREQDTTPVGVQSQKASGSLRDREQNIMKNSEQDDTVPVSM